jgi:hypothetical protein
LAHEQCVFDEFIRVTPFRPKAKHVIHYAVFDGYEGGSTRYRAVDKNLAGYHQKAMIHSQVMHAHPDMWPKQLSLRP